MSKMTYREVLTAVALLSALPLDVKVKEKEGEYTRSLDSKLTGRVLSLLANLNLHAKTYAELEMQTRRALVSDEQVKRFMEYQSKAEKASEDFVRDSEIEAEIMACNSRINAAMAEINAQEVEVKPLLFSAEEYAQITEHTQGAEIVVNGQSVPRLHWLADFGALLVEK